VSGVVDVLVTVLIIAAVVALLFAVAVVGKRGLVNVPLRHSAIVTRKFGSFRQPVSFAAAVDAHTRLLEGGRLRWVAWWLYDVVLIKNVIIPPDSVGIVHALLGEPLDTNQTVARPVLCQRFRDVGAFLAGGGQQGPQVEVLPGGSHAIHPEVFEVRVVKRVTVPMRSVGLVKANVGAIMSPGHTLATYVECDHFQDGVAFLAGGGEQGIQQAVLPGGSNFAINPVMFDVITVDTVEETTLDLSADDLRLESVDAEDVGVVIVTESRVRGDDDSDDSDAPAPVVPGHDHFQRPWVFLANGGRVGPQSEVLPGGSTYAINPLFARVVHIPTRELILSWRAKDADADRYDSALQPVELTIEGFKLWVELTQTLAIPKRSAPILVKRFGEDADEDGDTGHRKPAAVKRLVARVLGPVVQGYFNEVAARYQIEDFIRSQETVRNELFDQVFKALEELWVEARLTTIVSVKFESDEINAEFRKLADLRHEVRLLEQQLSVEKVRNKVIEEQLKAERAKLAASEEVLIDLFGREHRRRERELDRIIRAPVPQMIVAGGDTPIGPLMMPQLIRRDQLLAPPEQKRWTIEMREPDGAATREIQGTIGDADDSPEPDGATPAKTEGAVGNADDRA
jgi:hypothetical protein